MQLRITIPICMVEIRNRKTLQSKVNICKSDVKIGDYADSLMITRCTANQVHLRLCHKDCSIWTTKYHGR